MPLYTTGELAKLCSVTVRTIQYYDSRGLLSPSMLSEGGRRLYTEKELEQLQLICFLRELDFSIDNIKLLFAEENASHVIDLLLDEQEAVLRHEIAVKTEKADVIAAIKKARSENGVAPLSAFPEASKHTENKKQLKRLRIKMLVIGLFMDTIEITTWILVFLYKLWWLVPIALLPVIALGIYISRLYCKRVAFICPECHTVFQPTVKESFWARHTPNTRKLTCPHCKQHGFCVECYHE